MPGLLDPLKVGKLQLRNRIVMLPMSRGSSGFLTESGRVTDYLITHYERRAPRLGLMIVESLLVSTSGRYTPYLLGIHDDEFIPGLRKLADRVHKYNTPVAIQLNHGGGKATAELCGTKPIAPSQILLEKGGEVPKALDADDIERLVQDYARAAAPAAKAGFDAIQLHGAHGLLINQFTSRFSNRRRDQYGGTLENRMRFPVQIIAEIRKDHADLPIIYRLGVDYDTPTRTLVEESRAMARMLQDADVDVLDVSAGFHGVAVPPADSSSEGHYIPIAEKIRKQIHIPVIGIGRITSPRFADDAIREGRVDLIGVGRAILADPDWPSRARQELSKLG